MPVFNAWQVLGKRLASGTFALAWLGRAQLFYFGLLRAGIGMPAFLEQFALFRRELFALVGKANALVVRNFKGQRLDFEVGLLESVCIALGLFEQLADPGRQRGFGVESGKFSG